MRPDDDLQEIRMPRLVSLQKMPCSSDPSASGAPTKIVVADTSPLNYLVQIECNFLLPLLYTRVITPPVVIAELTHIGAPLVVSTWASLPPAWLEVLPLRTRPDEKLCLLDAGERDAIQLALELNVSEVLIDEFKGRREAGSRGLSIIGTLGILLASQREHLVDARRAFDRLITQTDIYIAPQLRQTFLQSILPPILN